MKDIWRIKPMPDGKFDVYESGDWLGSFNTQAEADTEVSERRAYRAVWQERNGGKSE